LRSKACGNQQTGKGESAHEFLIAPY
jgi:hypothetical protein